jgi:hypothetical protein
MFTPADIRSRLAERPFTPFALVLTTGEQYVIRHPEQIWIAALHLYVSTAPTGAFPTSEQIRRIALLHVVELRELPNLTPTTGNGEA